MDAVSHVFWTALAAKAAKSKIGVVNRVKPLNVKMAAVFGAFPDIIAFAPILISVILSLLLGIGQVSLYELPRPSEFEPATTDTLPIFKLTNTLYNISHSVVVFIIVFILAGFISRRIRYEFLGWLLHILIDIPTHSYKFFPTPVFWPVWKWMFDGISWATQWFMAINYGVIFIISILYFYRRKRKKNTFLSR